MKSERKTLVWNHKFFGEVCPTPIHRWCRVLEAIWIVGVIVTSRNAGRVKTQRNTVSLDWESDCWGVSHDGSKGESLPLICELAKYSIAVFSHLLQGSFSKFEPGVLKPGTSDLGVLGDLSAFNTAVLVLSGEVQESREDKLASTKREGENTGQNPTILISMNNLVSVLLYQGKYKEVEKIKSANTRRV